MPYAACGLKSHACGLCERCYGRTAEASAAVSCTSPRGCRATYCSAECREADFRDNAHEAALGRDAGPLGAHARHSEDLSAAADGAALDRFGTLLLAARCLWRRGQRGDAPSPGTGAHEPPASGGSTTRHLPSPATDDTERLLVEELLATPAATNAAADDALAALAGGVAGFLPPMAEPRDLVAMIGKLRAYSASIEEVLPGAVEAAARGREPLDEPAARGAVKGQGEAVGVGLYPRFAILNHACDPNCAVRWARGGHLLVVVTRDVPMDAELTIGYCALDEPRDVRRAELRERYGFECDCARCAAEQAQPRSESVETAAAASVASVLGVHTLVSESRGTSASGFGQLAS